MSRTGQPKHGEPCRCPYCNKLIFRSFPAATRALNNATTRREVRGDERRRERRAYPCRRSLGWHLTSLEDPATAPESVDS